MADSFQANIDAFVARTRQRLDDTVFHVVAEVVERVDDRSPVGDPSYWRNPPPADYRPGAFRGNWQLTVGAPATGETGRIDPGGAATVSDNIGRIPVHAAGLVFYLANNRDYARRLEDGWSPQAPPGGIVGLTAMEFPQIVRRAVARAGE